MSTVNQTIAYRALAMKVSGVIAGVADIIEFGSRDDFKISNFSSETSVLQRVIKIIDCKGDDFLKVTKSFMRISLETRAFKVEVNSYNGAHKLEANSYRNANVTLIDHILGMVRKKTTYTHNGKQITESSHQQKPLTPFGKDESDMVVGRILRHMIEDVPLGNRGLVQDIVNFLMTEKNLWRKNDEFRKVWLLANNR